MLDDYSTLLFVDVCMVSTQIEGDKGDNVPRMLEFLNFLVPPNVPHSEMLRGTKAKI